MSKKYDKSTGIKIISIVLGLCAGGFAWRLRGDDGYGSFWGLTIVGAILTMAVFAVYGDRIKMKSELIPIGALMAGAAVTGYGTFMLQFCGIMTQTIDEEPYIIYENVSVKSGMTIWIIMAFTLVPLFAIFIGTLFTKKKDYKIYHYAILIAVYLGVAYICKASVSHFIVRAICPEQTAFALKGLQSSGITDLTPMQVYLRHFADRSFAESIPYFENYFMCVESVSKAIAAIVTFIVVLVIFKDTLSCLVGLFINTFTAAGTVLFTTFIATDYASTLPAGTYAGPLALSSAPYWITGGGVWGMWEFGVGLSLGFSTMLILALLPKKYTEGTSFKSRPYIENGIIRYIVNFLGFTFIFGVATFRAFGRRLGDLIELVKPGIGNKVETITLIAGSVIIGIYFLFRFRKEILKRDLPVPFEMKPQKFACIALPLFLGAHAINYLFLGAHKYFISQPFSAFKNGIKAGMLALTSNGNIVTVAMVVAVTASLIICIPIAKKQSK